MNNKSIITTVFGMILLSFCGYAAVDPTRPPGQQQASESNAISKKKLKLQGLVFGEKSWVVINDLVLQQGQSKKGISVLQIKKDSVLVIKNGKKIWLNWQSEVIKKHLNAELIK